MKPLQAVALMGATGTGKSALALQVAARDDRCIIACDSMQVYRGLDIGTAKPSFDEQQQVRHALLDCVDVSQVWDAQLWVNAARAVIRRENVLGKTPLIVGGTGMYLKALCQGFAQVPAMKDGVRSSLELALAAEGVAALYAQLQAVDPILAQRLQAQDSQRILRGLCVFKSTGKPLSVWHAEQANQQQQVEQAIHCPTFILEMERSRLRTRLAERCQQMLAKGWLDECVWLQSQQLDDTHPVMRAVGYRQLLNHLQAKTTLQQAMTDAITASRRYAKRQNTWFRNQTPNATKGDSQQFPVWIKSLC